MSETQPTRPEKSGSDQEIERMLKLTPRRRRRWPWILGVIVLLLVGLVILAPTIASTAPVRSFVVGKVNQNLNGKIAIDGWSLGWLGGAKVSGIKIYDEHNALIADVPRIVTGLTLLDAVRGNFDIGDTQIDVASFVARVDEQGEVNFARLAKESKEPQPKEGPIELPDLTGKVTVNIDRGTVESQGKPPVHMDKSSFVLNIPGVNQPIENDVKLAFHVGDAGAPGSVELTGKLDAFENNRLDFDRIDADQKIALGNVNLGAAAPFVQGMQLGGVVNGALDVRMQGVAGIGALGEIVVDNFAIGGEVLNGDTFRTSRLTLPVQVTRSIEGGTTILKIEKLGVQMPEAAVAIAGAVPEQALLNVIDQKKPGAAGDVQINITSEKLADIANQLPNTLKLREGVKFQSGRYAQVSKLVFQPESVNIAQTIDVAAAGTSDGKPVTLSPVHAETAVTMIPTGEAMPRLEGLNLLLQSTFASLTGGGKSLAELDINGTFDLELLRRELGQFASMPEELKGNGKFALSTRGDPTKSDQPLSTSVKLNLYGAGQTQALVDVDVAADVRFADATVPRFELKTLTVTDLNQFQQQFGALVPALAEQKIHITSGQLYAKATGAFDGTNLTLSQPLSVSLTGLAASKDGRELLRREVIRANVKGKVSMPEDGLSASLSDLSVTTESKLVTVSKTGESFEFAMSEKRGLRGNGALTIAADLKRLNDLSQAFGDEPVDPAQPQLASGMFNGTLKLVKVDQPQTSIDFNCELSQLTVTANGATPVQNEKIAIMLKAEAPDDLKGASPITADGKVTSSFATADLIDVHLLPNAATWDMIQKAVVKAQVPDLPKLYALANAFAPPAAPAEPVDAETAPLAPLELTDGSAVLDVTLERDAAKKVTVVNLSQARIERLGLKRGERMQQLDPISLKLAAHLNASEQIDSLEITELAAESGIATVSMPEKIRITDLATKPKASGAIAARGFLERLTPLLAVLGGSEEMPYSGEFAINQRVRTEGEIVVLAGEVTTQGFKVFQTPQRRELVFEESQVTVRNDLSLDPSKEVALIKTLTIDMPTTKTLAVSLTGGVQEWSRRRVMKDVKLDLTYDLAKVWPLVKPMLDPETQESLKDLKVAGQFTRQFVVEGSYPAIDVQSGRELQWWESIRTLDSHGGLAVQLFDAMGFTVENLEVPVNLDKGELSVVYAGKSKDERLPKPARCNGGSLDIGGIRLSLGQEIPRLSIGKNQRLLRDVTINPALGNTLGKYVNPVFPNSERSKGLLDVTVSYCENVALGEALTTEQSGRARVVFSIRDLDIANPLGSMMLGPILGALKIGDVSEEQADTFRGLIRDAVVTLENGHTKPDMTILLEDTAKSADVVAGGRPPEAVLMPLRFQGDIRLSDLSQSLNVTLPTQFLAKFFRSEKDQRVVAQIFPEGIPISLRGTTVKPKVDVGNIGQRIVEGQLKGLLGGEGKEGGGGGLGGLLEDVLKKGDKDREKERERKK